jgi:carbonic anhydrase
MASSNQQNLASKNAQYASSFSEGSLALPPAKKYLVGLCCHDILEGCLTDAHQVTCMDARIDPAAAYGINLGDAHVVRNAGGNAKDALRSIVISQQLLGTTEIILVKHTGCGMLTFDNATAQGIVEKNLGPDAKEALGAFGGDFQPFPDLDGAVKSDVQLLKESPLVGKNTTVSGWVYEVETGKVRQIV